MKTESKTTLAPPTEVVKTWIEQRVLSVEEHCGIMSKIGILQRANMPIPLQYALYKELANNNGILPDYIVGDDTIVRQKRKTIEAMVPDVAATIFRLEEANLKVLTDPRNELDNPTMQRIMAGEMARTLRNTYPANHHYTDTNYPLKEGVEDVVANQMRQGMQDTFAVIGNDGMMAVFCNVRKHDILNRPHLIELGRAGTDERYRSFLRDNHLSLRGISQLRLLQIFFNAQYREPIGDAAKAVYTDMRIKKDEFKDPETGEFLYPGGRGVEGVWFGGVNNKNHPVDLGMGVWGVGSPYNLGKLEPFLRAGQWLDQEKALSKLQQEIIWVPNEAAKHIILSYLSSFTPEVEKFNVQVLSEHAPRVTGSVDPMVAFTNNGDKVFAGIDIIDATEETERITAGILRTDCVMPLSEALAKAYEAKAPYIETYVECTTGENGNVEQNIVRLNERMQTLIDKGFVVTGFTPTDKGNGGIRLTFALITKYGFEQELYDHYFPPEYFQGNRLEKAIEAAGFAMQNLKDHSRRSALNN